MNLYDAAYQLVRAMKESEEYKDVERLQKKVNQDESTKKMYEEFRMQEMAYQLKQMSGEEVSQEEEERIQQLFEVLRLNPDIAQLLDAERRFSLILNDVNRIVAEPLQELFPDTNFDAEQH